jgi:RNA polymerase sigma-70 factor, ECF subfamily
MNEHWSAFADHIEAVRRYARAIGRDATHADDLVQECLARALSRPRDWRDVRDARAYLLTILHNLHVDDVARRWRDGVSVPIDDADPGLACAPEQFGRRLLRDLARSLQALPEERRRLLLLVALEGMSYQQVAHLLRMPIGTVMSRLSRTRDTLRRLMEDEGPASHGGRARGRRQDVRHCQDVRSENLDHANAMVAE